jgi:hypothetical protein
VNRCPASLQTSSPTPARRSARHPPAARWATAMRCSGPRRVGKMSKTARSVRVQPRGSAGRQAVRSLLIRPRPGKITPHKRLSQRIRSGWPERRSIPCKVWFWEMGVLGRRRPPQTESARPNWLHPRLLRVARHRGATQKLSSAGNPFPTTRDQALGGCRNCPPSVTQLAKSAVVLLRLNEFMKELSHFAFRCH